jgi:hypothetical protein
MLAIKRRIGTFSRAACDEGNGAASIYQQNVMVFVSFMSNS